MISSPGRIISQEQMVEDLLGDSDVRLHQHLEDEEMSLEAASELFFESEELYVHNGLTLVRDVCDQLNAYIALDREIINEEEIAVIFRNFNFIFDFHSRLLRDMKKLRMQNQQAFINGIGLLMTRYIPFFKLYTTFISDRPVALTMLKELRVRNGNFDLFLRVHERCAGKGFTEYLQVPIRRFGQYLSLLGAIHRNSSLGDSFRPSLATAIHQIQAMTEQITTRQQEERARRKVLDVQDNVFGGGISLVSPHRFLVRRSNARVLVKSSTLFKTTKKWEDICVFLFNDLLLYGTLAGKLLYGRVKGQLPLEQIKSTTIVDPAIATTDSGDNNNSESHVLSLEIEGAKEPLVFAFVAEEVQTRWYLELTKQHSLHARAVKDLAGRRGVLPTPTTISTTFSDVSSVSIPSVSSPTPASRPPSTGPAAISPVGPALSSPPFSLSSLPVPSPSSASSSVSSSSVVAALSSPPRASVFTSTYVTSEEEEEEVTVEDLHAPVGLDTPILSFPVGHAYGWVRKIDAESHWYFYYHEESKTTSWEIPEQYPEWERILEPTSGEYYYENVYSGETQWEEPVVVVPCPTTLPVVTLSGIAEREGGEGLDDDLLGHEAEEQRKEVFGELAESPAPFSESFLLSSLQGDAEFLNSTSLTLHSSSSTSVSASSSPSSAAMGEVAVPHAVVSSTTVPHAVDAGYVIKKKQKQPKKAQAPPLPPKAKGKKEGSPLKKPFSSSAAAASTTGLEHSLRHITDAPPPLPLVSTLPSTTTTTATATATAATTEIPAPPVAVAQTSVPAPPRAPLAPPSATTTTVSGVTTATGVSSANLFSAIRAGSSLKKKNFPSSPQVDNGDRSSTSTPLRAPPDSKQDILSAIRAGAGSQLKKAKPRKQSPIPDRKGGGTGQVDDLQTALAVSIARFRKFVVAEESDTEKDDDWA